MASNKNTETETETDALIKLMMSLGGIPRNHLTIAQCNLHTLQKQDQTLLMQKKLPLKGMSDLQIERLLLTLASLDSNNFNKKCSVGEREGRVYSSLVQRRHYGMSHGIGRSGDIIEAQPKAAGSSVLYKLTTYLMLDVVRRGCGLKSTVQCEKGSRPGPANEGILLPLCTGMSMTMTLQALRSECKINRNVVLWSRIDQKSCLKAILAAGFQPVVIPTLREGDEVRTDISAMQRSLEIHKGNVVAVITTTSGFAPRVPDAIDDVAKMCDNYQVPHVINNAYGLQCAYICKLLNRACTVGRVDAIIQSTDKNFMVPVGGAIILSPHTRVIQSIGKVYPGRANAAPILDLFITLLSMGLDGYKALLAKRIALTQKFQSSLLRVCERHGERMLLCPKNTISFGMTLNQLHHLVPSKDNSAKQNDIASVSYFGSMLFTRCISGTRVVPRGQQKNISNIQFQGFGSSTDDYPDSYLTAACAIGLNGDEVDDYIERLDRSLKDCHKKNKKQV